VEIAEETTVNHPRKQAPIYVVRNVTDLPQIFILTNMSI
jgi:hypothetical protein